MDDHAPNRHTVETEGFAALVRERYWSMIALLCLLAAVVLLWLWRPDAVFVVATLGVLAWFLDVRNRLRSAHIEPVSAISDDEIGSEERKDESNNQP